MSLHEHTKQAKNEIQELKSRLYNAITIAHFIFNSVALSKQLFAI